MSGSLSRSSSTQAMNHSPNRTRSSAANTSVSASWLGISHRGRSREGSPCVPRPQHGLDEIIGAGQRRGQRE
jgi:hypothetical protein